jgi:hypothetical protein
MTRILQTKLTVLALIVAPMLSGCDAWRALRTYVGPLYNAAVCPNVWVDVDSYVEAYDESSFWGYGEELSSTSIRGSVPVNSCNLSNDLEVLMEFAD